MIWNECKGIASLVGEKCGQKAMFGPDKELLLGQEKEDKLIRVYFDGTSMGGTPMWPIKKLPYCYWHNKLRNLEGGEKRAIND